MSANLAFRKRKEEAKEKSKANSMKIHTIGDTLSEYEWSSTKKKRPCEDPASCGTPCTDSVEEKKKVRKKVIAST